MTEGYGHKVLPPLIPGTLLAMCYVVSMHTFVEAKPTKQDVQSQAPMPELMIQLGHAGFVLAVDFSRDGRFVVTGGMDGTVRLWEAGTGREIRKFVNTPKIPNEKPKHFVSVGISSDNRYILAGENFGIVYQWETETGKQLRRWSDRFSKDFVFSPDGQFIFSGSNLCMCSEEHVGGLWDLKTGNRLRRFVGHGGELTAVGYAPDGMHVVSGDTKGEVRLWNVSNGKTVRIFKGHQAEVLTLAVSPDGRLVASGGSDGTVNVWERQTGRHVQKRSEPFPVATILFLPRAQSLLLIGMGPASKDSIFDEAKSVAKVVDLKTGKEIRRFTGYDGGPDKKKALAMSLDGSRVAVTSSDVVRLADTLSGEEIRSLQGLATKVFAPEICGQGEFFLLRSGELDKTTISLWSLSSGKLIRQFHNQWWNGISFSADCRMLATGDEEEEPGRKGGIQLWDTSSGDLIAELKGHGAAITTVAFSRDGRFLVSGSRDSQVRVWDLGVRLEHRLFDPKVKSLLTLGVEFVDISPDGVLVLAGFGGMRDSTIYVWERETKKEVLQFEEASGSLGAGRFFDDGRMIATKIFYLGRPGHDDRSVLQLRDLPTGRELLPGGGILMTRFVFSHEKRIIATTQSSSSRTSTVWEHPSGKVLAELAGHSDDVTAIAMSLDSRLVLTGSNDRTARLWDRETGKEIHRFDGHVDWVMDVGFLQNEELLYTSDGTALFLWDARTKKELCRLVTLADGHWVVVDPGGRFDTDDLEEVHGLHWIRSSDPLKPLPVEAFMKDYYEPDLLRRILAGEQLAAVESLATVNVDTPRVVIRDISPDSQNTERLAVTVEVTRPTGSCSDESHGRISNGVYDLRLFRNRQLVGYMPANDGVLEIDERSEVATVRLSGIQVPRNADPPDLEFSAYAFNCDRIKGETARRRFTVQKEKGPIKRRAYVISVGVNTYQNPSWNLRFAVNDALRLQAAVVAGLMQSHDYEEIVPVALTLGRSETGHGSKGAGATKDQVRAVLGLLAGHAVSDEQRETLPNFDRLVTATPNDLVILSFATHGYRDEHGIFYLFPSDIGPGHEKTIEPDLLRKTISSEELASWLRDIDAAELVMIVDACQSAASVEGTGFKPGPMGSRGLGQLAYDKGMRILAASQADNVALESRRIKQGLLTYALVHDGLEAEQADYRPKDGRITLIEWLAYGVDRVPMLAQELKSRALQTFGIPGQDRGAYLVYEGEDDQRNVTNVTLPIQQPALFDFRKASRFRSNIVLMPGK